MEKFFFNHKQLLCTTQRKLSLKMKDNERFPRKMHVSKTNSGRDIKCKQNNFLWR